MSVVEWKEPALLWNSNLTNAGRPRILEIREDEFIPNFLQAMLGDDPAPYFQKHQIDGTFDTQEPLTLFQPLHGCYYLVTASLVCRQVGLPDKAILRADNESVSFVIRRRTDGGEEAWIPEGESGFWQRLAGDEVFTVAPGEERLPMHPVTVCSKPKTPHSVFTDFVERDLHYGYIPAGNRKKYTDTIARTGQKVTSAEDVMQFFVDIEQGQGSYSFQTALFQQRVEQPWLKLLAYKGRIPKSAPTDESEQWLYIILELGDFLKNNLPTLWAALEAEFAGTPPVDARPDGALGELFDLLGTKEVIHNSSHRTVRKAVVELEQYFELVRGRGAKPGGIFGNGTRTLDGKLQTIDVDYIDSLESAVALAVVGEQEPMLFPDGEDSELIRLINHQVQPEPAEGAEPRYHLRTVYEYDPDCPPIVSQMPSQPFTLAKLMDPDAPARLIRLEPPSMKPRDLRKYARGVGISMSPEMQKLTNCFSGDTVDEIIQSVENCDGSQGLSIEMICTFSIQIIFLVAFIVMFIFLIILNFVFWWLPFLRICLPIPRRT